MTESFNQVCFQIEEKDNVCTALADLAPGAIKVNGAAQEREIVIASAIKQGHKLANKAITTGQDIIKYGVVIGRAKVPISKGEWVHLHNCVSLYDARSATLDVETGAPTDTKYV
jgi:altronate dehydratase small subunit